MKPRLLQSANSVLKKITGKTTLSLDVPSITIKESEKEEESQSLKVTESFEETFEKPQITQPLEEELKESPQIGNQTLRASESSPHK